MSVNGFKVNGNTVRYDYRYLDNIPDFEGAMAEDYNSTKTYNIGEYVLYNGSLYRCTTPITIAENWTATHWEAVDFGNEIEALRKSSQFNSDAIFDYFGIDVSQTSTGWRLEESGGCCRSNSEYKIVKYRVTAGQKIRVVSDDRFQFQSSSSVPSISSGVNNALIGSVYKTGTFFLTVPASAAFLIFSTPISNSAHSVSEAIVKNDHNLLSLYGLRSNRTHNGVTFSWSGLTCSVSGTATDGALCPIISSPDIIPSYIKPGCRYKVFYNSTDNNIQIEWLIYKDGGYDSTTRFTKTGIFNMPNDAGGVVIRLRVPGGSTANGSITPIIIEYPETSNINTRLKIANFGDALTFGRNGAYTSIVQDALTITDALKDLGCDAYNFGVANQGYVSLGNNRNALQELQATDLTSYDIITLGFGLNDNTARIGLITDTDGTTILGAMRQCWQYIRSQNSKCVVIFIAPPNASFIGSEDKGYWYSYRRGPFGEYNLSDLVEAMREFCTHYSVPFIDNLDNGIDVTSISTLQPDGIHYNRDGYNIYSRYIANKIVNCAYSAPGSHHLTSVIDVKRENVTNEIFSCSRNSVGNYIFTIYPSNQIRLTDYIAVNENRKIRLTNIRLNNRNLLVVFDKYYDVITRVYIDEDAHDIETYDYLLPYGAAYIRFCVTQAQVSTFNVAYADYATAVSENEFYPYIHNKELFKRINDRAPICVLIDDDTQGLGYVRAFHERCVANNIRGNYAVVTKNLDTDSALAEELLSYEAEGFGMLYHCDEQLECYRGVGNENRNLSLAEQNFVTGLRKMRTYGFLDYEWWVVPYGTIDDDMVAIGQRHGMKACMSVANATYVTTSKRNNRWKIPRCSLNVSDASSLTGYTMAALKSDLDACYAEHGLIIITTHMNDGWAITNGELDSAGKARFDEAIQYAKNLGYQFMSLQEAMTYWMPVYQLQEKFGD